MDVPMNRVLVRNALTFAFALPPGTPRPNIGIGEDGAVVLEWRETGLLVAFDPDDNGEYGYAIKREKLYVAGAAQGALDRLPADLLAALPPPSALQVDQQKTEAQETR